MLSVYLCLLLSNLVLSANITVHTKRFRTIYFRSSTQYISNRFMSFTLKTCSTAYVVLLSRKPLVLPTYTIVIGGLNADSCIIRYRYGNEFPGLCGNKQQVLHCDNNTDLFITWNESTITVGLGLESNGSVFLICIGDTNLWPFEFVNIRIWSNEMIEWILYYTLGSLSISEEETVNKTDVQTHSQTKTANDLSTLSIGTSIPSPNYTLTEIMTMSAETTEVPEITTTDGMTTTTDGMIPIFKDLQSTITIGDTEISDTSGKLPSTKSTTIPLERVTTPSHHSLVGIEPSTTTCKCNCPKTSVTPINNDMIDQLKIDKKTLSSYKRRQKSATDPRKSSFYIGCIGITVLVISVAFIVLLDFIPRA